MAAQKPLVIIGGQIQQIPTGDTISVAASGGETVSMTNANAGALVIGTPVYVSAASSVNKANATGVATAKVLGLVSDASVATGNPANVMMGGIFVATTGQWDAVAETAIGVPTSGGLTAGSEYFLSSTVGKICATAPSGALAFVGRIGVALSTTELSIEIDPTGVLLS